MDESMLAFLRESQVSFTNSQAEQDVRMIDKGATEGLGQGPVQAGAQDFVPLRRVLSSAWKPAATTSRPCRQRPTSCPPTCPLNGRPPPLAPACIRWRQAQALLNGSQAGRRTYLGVYGRSRRSVSTM